MVLNVILRFLFLIIIKKKYLRKIVDSNINNKNKKQ